MNLKTTCKTAFALAIFSVIFTTIGNFWIYLPTIVRTPHFESIVYVAGVILTSMFIGIGLVLLIFSSLLKSHHH